MIAPNAEVLVLEPYRAKQGTAHALLVPRVAAPLEFSLRRAAAEADVTATGELNLSQLWRELARGLSKVVDGFVSTERCYLVLASVPATAAKPLEGRRLEILEAVLGGSRQKSIAIDSKLAPSTIALNSRLALESLGVKCKPSRAHPLLMVAAGALNQSQMFLARTGTFVTPDQRELRVVSIARPDLRLANLLPPAEREVVGYLVEGLTYASIAKRRGTSTRTVANQITAVFRRLHLSGRNELVQHLCFDGPAVASIQPERAASAAHDSQRCRAPKAETLAPPQLEAALPAPPMAITRRSA